MPAACFFAAARPPLQVQSLLLARCHLLPAFMTPDSPAPETAAMLPPAARPINPVMDMMMEPQRGLDLRQFWHALLERIWIVSLCVLTGLFVALGYLGRTP